MGKRDNRLDVCGDLDLDSDTGFFYFFRVSVLRGITLLCYYSLDVSTV